MNSIFFWLTNILLVAALTLVAIMAIRKPAELRYTFLNLFRQRRRTSMTLLAIILGGVAIFIFGGFIHYSFWAMREQTIHTSLGHIQIYQQGYLQKSASETLRYTIKDYENVKQQLLSDPELSKVIRYVSGQLTFSGIISQYENGASGFFSGVGMEPLSGLYLGSFDRIVSGSSLSRVVPHGITLGEGLSAGLSAGYDSWVDMLAVNPQGGQNAISLQVRGISRSGLKEYDDTLVKMPLITAQKLLQTQGVSKIIVLLNQTEQTEQAIARINTLINQNHWSLESRSWSELAISWHQTVTLFEGIFLFIKTIIGVIVVFMIGNTLMMNVMERTREIATLRALGFSRLAVSRLFILEGIFIGLVGALLSTATGVLLSILININGIPVPPSPGRTEGYLAFVMWENNYSLFWFTLALPLTTSILASVLPAYRAARLVIADAFRFV